MVPGVRTFVSLPAGIELMPQPLFLLWTTAGSLVWLLGLTVAGLALGASYSRVGALLKPFTSLLGAGLGLAGASLLVWMVLRHLRERSRKG